MIFGNSGYLLSQIALLREGDLYIPADNSYVAAGRTHLSDEAGESDPLLADSVALAKFRLCIAVQRGNTKKISSLDDLLRDDVKFGLADPQAGVGRMAKLLLQRAGRWNQMRGAAKVQKDTVSSVAQDVQTNALDAGLIWDAVARQYGLEVIHVPEFVLGEATIEAAVTKDSQHPQAARHFARFLGSTTKGQRFFDQHGYSRITDVPQ